MKTKRPALSLQSRWSAALLAAIAALALATAATPQAAKPTSLIGVECTVKGPIFSVPDCTAREDSDQCRSTNLGGTALGQRATTLDLTALGHPDFSGEHTRSLSLEIGAKSASLGDEVTFSFWVTKNCRLTAVGTIVDGSWPLVEDGSRLVVEVAAGKDWTFTRYGGGPADCNYTNSNLGPVLIAATRNDARLRTSCDCPCYCPSDL